jgi:hypothetical protein
MIFADEARLANTLNVVDDADVMKIYLWGKVLFNDEIMACLLLRVDNLIRISAVHNQTSILYLLQGLSMYQVLHINSYLMAIGYQAKVGMLQSGVYWMRISWDK